MLEVYLLDEWKLIVKINKRYKYFRYKPRYKPLISGSHWEIDQWIRSILNTLFSSSKECFVN